MKFRLSIKSLLMLGFTMTLLLMVIIVLMPRDPNMFEGLISTMGVYKLPEADGLYVIEFIVFTQYPIEKSDFYQVNLVSGERIFPMDLVYLDTEGIRAINSLEQKFHEWNSDTIRFLLIMPIDFSSELINPYQKDLMLPSSRLLPDRIKNILSNR